MNPKDPERLRNVADSPLARGALASAAEEMPSPELSQRMARALGVSLAAGAGAGAAQAAAAKTASTASAGTTAGTTASAGTSAAVPWLAVGAIVAVVAGGTLVGARAWQRAHREPAPPPPATAPLAPPPAAATPTPAVTPPAAHPEPADSPSPAPRAAESATTSRRPRGPAQAPELREQTAILDAARTAIAAGAPAKALGLVRQYQERYPSGVFVPEAAALRIEALVRLGRGAEARALAERFVASQPAGPLTERVKALTRASRL